MRSDSPCASDSDEEIVLLASAQRKYREINLETPPWNVLMMLRVNEGLDIRDLLGLRAVCNGFRGGVPTTWVCALLSRETLRALISKLPLLEGVGRVLCARDRARPRSMLSALVA